MITQVLQGGLKMKLLKYSFIKANFSTFNDTDPLISVKDAYRLLNDNKSVFIDTRDPKYFGQGHIPVARKVNEIFTYLSTSDEQGKKEMSLFFEKVLKKAGITGNEHIITYEDCLKTRFGASCRGYYILSLLGLKNVNVLHGGWERWLKENLPTSTETTEVKYGSFQVNWNESIFAGKEDVLKALNNPYTLLLDVRDYDEWKAESSSPYGVDFAPRKGRIPGAKHIMWKDLMNVSEGITLLKDPSQVEEICQEKGISKDKEVIIYCFKGARASNTFIAMKRAGYNVKNYFASWNEWSRDPNLPIDGGLI